MASTKGSKSKSRASAASGTSKKKSSGATAGGKKRSTQAASQTRDVRERPERQKSSPEIQREAVLWLVLAFSIFAFISYFGIGGFVGSVISDISFGLFGVLAYLLPFLVFLAAAFLISNKGNHIVGFKLASAAGLYLCLCSLMELMVNGYQPEIRITKLYSDSAALKTGGGAIGGAVCSLLCPALGSIGAGIVLLILTIVCLLILTQRSLMGGVRRQSKRVYDSAQASRMRRQEKRQRELLEESNAGEDEPFIDKDTVIISQESEQLKETWTAPSPVGKRKKTLSRRERAKAAREQERMQNTEPAGEGTLEIPVIFPSRPQKRRMDHRVSGITSNTTLEEERRAAAGKRESSRRRSAISAASMVNQQRDSRKASVSVFPGSKEETSYISLDGPEISAADSEEMERKASVSAAAQPEKDILPNVRIRGLGNDSPDNEDDYYVPMESSENGQYGGQTSYEDTPLPWSETADTVRRLHSYGEKDAEYGHQTSAEDAVRSRQLRAEEDAEHSRQLRAEEAAEHSRQLRADQDAEYSRQLRAEEGAEHSRQFHADQDAEHSRQLRAEEVAEHNHQFRADEDAEQTPHCTDDTDETNSSADYSVTELHDTVPERKEKSVEQEPQQRKRASSAWDGIWADETDVSRGGTSGTVFRDERRPANGESGQQKSGMVSHRASEHQKISELPASGQKMNSQMNHQTVSGEDTDAADTQAQSAGADGGHIKKNPRSSQQEIAAGIASVEAEAAKTAEVVKPEYVFPPLELLKKGKNKNNSSQEQEIRKTAAKLQQTLDSFGVRVTVTDVSCGPAVTRYELQPEQGVKVSRIVSLADDIKLNLAAADIRIEAPIPGKAAVGIEVPNAENSAVMLRDLLESEEFQNHPSHLAFATGKDIGGKPVVSDIAKMPHLLIAGATGSGKSVCINTLIMSILYKADPEDVKLIMIDPKVVELSVYNGIPHLFIPVVTDPKKAAGALNWGVAEMTDRYNKFAEFGVRNLKGYNEKVEAMGLTGDDAPKKLPQIVIIVDELADLMMVAPGEVEDSICRLAQLARAAGIHLIIATQRPSVNVITGLIKANMPSRIAFSVSSSVDSRTIIDMGGAEKLLGKGDMLFYPQGYQKPERVQGAFVSDEEVADVVDFLKNKNVSEAYSNEMEQQMAKVQQAVSSSKTADDTDALFAEAGKFIIEKDKASIGMLQRVFKIGFNRAARIMDQLSDAGVVGPEEGTKPRKVLMTLEEFENTLE